MKNSGLICLSCGTPDSYSLDGKVWFRALGSGDIHPKVAAHNSCRRCTRQFSQADLVSLDIYQARTCKLGEALWQSTTE